MRLIVVVMEMFIKYGSLYRYCRGNSLRRSVWKLRYFVFVTSFNSYVLFHAFCARVRCVIEYELWGLPGTFSFKFAELYFCIQWMVRFGRFVWEIKQISNSVDFYALLPCLINNSWFICPKNFTYNVFKN